MITGIIFGAGFSRRLGKDKLLLEINGETIIEKVVKACYQSDLDNIILIYRKEEVRIIGDKYGIKSIYNKSAKLGQSESMKLGIEEAGNTDSYMFIVGDQPFLTSKLINKLIEDYNNTELPILTPYYNGNRGMPMIISNIYKEDLLKVVGDKGGRDIVKNNSLQVEKVYIDNGKLGIDIDTPEDLKYINIK